MRKKFTMLFAALLAFVGVVNAEGLEVGQRYRLKNVASGLYMQNMGLSTNLKLQNEQYSVTQFFYLEAAADNMYYLKTTFNGESRYVQATSWNAVVANDNDNKTPFTVTVVGGETDVYTLGQTVSNYTGNLGVDGTNAGESLYCNKGTDTKCQWQFEAVETPVACDFDPNKTYRIKSEYSGLYMELVNPTQTSGEGAFRFKNKSANAGQKFKFEAAEGVNEGKYYLKTIDGDKTFYVNASSWNFYAGSDATTPFAVEVVSGETAIYSLKQEVATYTGFAGNDNDATDGTSIYNNKGSLTKNTIWSFEEVADELVNVTYRYMYDDVNVYSENVSAVVGTEFPALTYSLPYGVSAEKPSGVVTTSGTYEINLTIEKELPFKAAADVESIDTWYYVQMHTNEPGYIGDIADDNSINVYTGKESDGSETFVWGFAGNVFEGITVVNKGTDLQLTSTGSGNVTLTEAGTAFFVAPTSQTTEYATNGFCLRKFDSDQYVNANYNQKKLSHWSANDAGSTFFATECDREYAVAVSAEAGYATYYSLYRLVIPETVKAYIVTEANEGSATLQQVTGVLPARTGVILEGEGTHTFVTTDAAAASVAGNKLQGTIAAKEVTVAENKAAYVLANGTSGVGLYKAKLTSRKFINGANKAYMILDVPTAGEAAPAMFSFGRGEGTTSIEDVELTNDNVVIYDITGRRVEKMEKGIYIVNGKKVLVK